MYTSCISASNLSMGPLVVSMPQKKYQGAFAADIPSTKLIGGSDLESDVMASQISERLSQQLQMAILVSCHFDDSRAPNTSIGSGASSDVERQMLRRCAVSIAEQKICALMRN
jgi:Proteasome assembly chaperone 4